MATKWPDEGLEFDLPETRRLTALEFRRRAAAQALDTLIDFEAGELKKRIGAEDRRKGRQGVDVMSKS